MRLLQFSTSHYCRKARLALGYKSIPYQTQNLSPGLHRLTVQPLTGLATLPVLLPQSAGQPQAIGDSSAILRYLESYQPNPSYIPTSPELARQVWLWEDWLDESVGPAVRFAYYDFRAGEGRNLDPSWSSQAVIQIVRWQYGMNSAAVQQAQESLALALEILSPWRERPYLVGDAFSIADLSAAALLSPLARIPRYRQEAPWLFERMIEIHRLCGEPAPPGLES
ncbi:MAG: glutathione S-transferase family protein [Cyanobacteriota bacterium]|nr:glutathione S-transferase family protein [Cyanobacteriota bacterium]